MKGFAALFFLSVALCSAGAQSLHSQIEASNKAAVKFMMAKDVKGLKQHMKSGVTSDFQYVEAGKSMDFDSMCAGMEMGLGGMQKMVKIGTELLTLQEKGDSAVATVRHTMIGTVMGADKKPHTLSFVGTSADTYVKQGGKWKMSKMAWLKQTMKTDGKTMGTPMAAAAKS